MSACSRSEARFPSGSSARFAEAVKFYRQRGTHLGARFDQEVRAAITKILTTPLRWRILEEDVRRCLVRVFPYSVLYTVEPDYILIIAIAHGKRQSGYWRNRLAKRF